MKFLSFMMFSSFLIVSAAQANSQLYIHHKVVDYPKWKMAFDAHKTKQMEAGLTNPRVYQTDSNPQDVSILFDAADSNKAKAFAESQDLKTTMKGAGVIGKPEMHVFSDQKM